MATSHRRSTAHWRARAPPPAPGFAGVNDAGMRNALAGIVARLVRVRTVDDELYEGLFSGTERGGRGAAADEAVLVLRYARVLEGAGVYAPPEEGRGGVWTKVGVPVGSVLRADAGAVGMEAVGGAGGFGTDGDIVRGGGGGRVGRTLKRFDDFVPGEKGGALDEDTCGDMATAGGKGKWDQFSVNAKRFGVVTSFDEDEYTTKIDRNGPDFAEKRKNAARLAAEIEGRQSSNVHMREERGQDIGNDYDEEDLYSGVKRMQPATSIAPPAEAAVASSAPAVSGKANAHQRSGTHHKGSAAPSPNGSKKGLGAALDPPASAALERPRLSYAAAAGAGKPAAVPGPGPGPAPAPVVAAIAAAATPLPPRSPATPSTPSTAGTPPVKGPASVATSNRSSRESLPQLAKVRSSAGGRTSPNQSRDSPRTTPAVSNTSAVSVLSLDAQTPNIGPEAIKRFERFKTNRKMQSITDNREKITDDLKKFSTQMDSRSGSLRRSGTASSSASAGTAASPPPAAVMAPPSPDASGAWKPKDRKAAEKKAGAPPTTSSSSSKLKKKLNPHASAFNPDAAPFQPAVQPPSGPQAGPPIGQPQYPPYPPNQQVVPEYSHQPAMRSIHGYPMMGPGMPPPHMQNMPYGQQPYPAGFMPGMATVGMQSGGPPQGYYLPDGRGFAMPPMHGQFPQQPQMGYGFGVPVQMPQPGPPLPQGMNGQQYQFYNNAPPQYVGAQPRPSSQGHMNQHIFQQHAQQGGPQQPPMTSMGSGGRGGGGGSRRGGGKGRSRQHGQSGSGGGGGGGGGGASVAHAGPQTALDQPPPAPAPTGTPVVPLSAEATPAVAKDPIVASAGER